MKQNIQLNNVFVSYLLIYTVVKKKTKKTKKKNKWTNFIIFFRGVVEKCTGKDFCIKITLEWFFTKKEKKNSNKNAWEMIPLPKEEKKR